MVRIKIIATLGPASSSEAVLKNMMVAGLDVVRLNFSHGTHEAHKARIELIRELNKKYRRRLLILQDLEGYRIRIGDLPNEVPLKKRQIITLTNRPDHIATNAIIPFDYENSLTDIDPNSNIYIEDGNIVLKVLSRNETDLSAEVVIPGILKSNKGVNIPDIHLNFSGLTKKDMHDLEFGIEQKVDLIAQSFVRSKEDMTILRKFITERGFNCKTIAKIENKEGIENLEEIMSACDGIMVARGDLGVSMPVYQIPVLQKEIIKKCNEKGKFVVTATQMLESMTENSRPTRAEVTDVANAIIDGTDYVMLSGETAVGADPAGVVRMMNDIIRYTEEYQSQNLKQCV